LGSEVDISAGSIESFRVRSGTEANISGGTIDNLSARTGGVVNISGGAVGFANALEDGSEVNISGGTVGDFFVGNFFNTNDSNVVNISGGTISDDFKVNAGCEVNLFGSDFALNGVPIDGLTINDAFTIVDRDVTLSGLLADGMPFSYVLFSTNGTVDFFSPNATLTVTLVSPVLLGDVDQDGVVGFSDIPSFIAVLQTGIYLEQADCNQDGEVTFADIGPFIAILTAS